MKSFFDQLIYDQMKVAAQKQIEINLRLVAAGKPEGISPLVAAALKYTEISTCIVAARKRAGILTPWKDVTNLSEKLDLIKKSLSLPSNIRREKWIRREPKLNGFWKPNARSRVGDILRGSRGKKDFYSRSPDPFKYTGIVVAIFDGIVIVHGIADVGYNETIDILTGEEIIPCSILNVESSRVSAVVSTSDRFIKPGQYAVCSRILMRVPAGVPLSGRIVDPLGIFWMEDHEYVRQILGE